MQNRFYLASLLIIAVLLIIMLFLLPLRRPLTSAQDAFNLGNNYFGNGRYDIEKAQEYFDEAVALDSELMGVHYQLARTYFIQSNFDDALGEINKEIELYPDFKRSYYVRALIYGYSGKLQEAEEDFKTFLEWKPDSWAGHNDLAWIYFQEEKFNEASDAAKSGLQYSPNNPWLLNSLGVSLMNLGDEAGAKEAFEKALAVVNSMSPQDWGSAYPGNDPILYHKGLSAMRSSVAANLSRLGSGEK
ncbi:MAG TPA: tetratricopeptide repeat protein [Candidatus Paceibacterota bacterium]